jgi:hypothetical protein
MVEIGRTVLYVRLFDACVGGRAIIVQCRRARQAVLGMILGISVRSNGQQFRSGTNKQTSVGDGRCADDAVTQIVLCRDFVLQAVLRN